MRRLRSLLLAAGVAVAGGAAATPALADIGFHFGIGVPPAYYYAPPPAYYYSPPVYYHSPYYIIY